MKFTKLLHYSLLVACIAFIFSCNKFESIPKPDMGQDYFPLKVNRVIIYNVDSTVYNNFNNTVTDYQFQLKDSITNKFTDAQGNEAYKVERYKKTSTRDWFFHKIIIRKTINSRAEEFIDNRRYVRLIFPPTLQSTWNGNLYNDIGEWRHEVIELDAPLTIGSNQLESTIITQYEEKNALTEDIYIETYAKNIGLVFKEVRAIEKIFNTSTIRRGYTYKMQLDSYK